MEKRRTVPVKLDVDRTDAALFRATVDEFLWASQYVTDHAFTGEFVTTSKTILNDETYDDVCEETDLDPGKLSYCRGRPSPPGVGIARSLRDVYYRTERLILSTGPYPAECIIPSVR